MSMIPVNEPLFVSGEKKYVAACIESGWVSSDGPFVKEFEEEFSSWCNRKYGVAVSSGTAALEVAMGAIGLEPGQEVIMPTFTIMSCALAVVTYGGVPVFVDADPETWTIDARKIEQCITRKTRAIMPVHIYGHPCDMAPIMDIAKKHNLKVIEDAAEAIGAKYRGKPCGSFGDISCFSFYANKILSTGEGGMVITNNKKYAQKAQLFRNLGFGTKKRFHYEALARNYRMTNLQAALGVAQLKNIEKLVAIKRKNAQRYTEQLRAEKGLQVPRELPWAKNVYWMYGVVLGKETKMNAETFAQKLKEKGIMTRPFFRPLHSQKVLQQV